jgi:hypothetical protein
MFLLYGTYFFMLIPYPFALKIYWVLVNKSGDKTAKHSCSADNVSVGGR